MTIHITFNQMKSSDSVSQHVQDVMNELLKITDNKYPFHVHLKKEKEEEYEVLITCTYTGKALSSKANSENLYKAIAESVDAMKTQVIKKAQKLRHE